MPVLRRLVPLVAALTVLCGSVSTWAAAGPTGDPSCCCPIKTACKCHDHDGKPSGPPMMQKCGGDSQVVAPAPLAATPALAFEVIPTTLVTRVTLPVLLPLVSDRTLEPETPPF